ncbi:MAG: hypothetical protein EXQ70_10375 [Solirubrobacterales bacterium]|nr:hypothetical protein [Solirubrobacterales bacterium]
MLRRLLTLLTAAMVLAAVAPALASAASAGPGRIGFIRNATSPFDPYLTGSSQAQREWMGQHYAGMRGYPPFFDQALSWAPPSDFYRDLYSLYRDADADKAAMQQHPEWVLRDGQNRKLFIPSGCDGTSCPQYAGDIGSPGFRAWWISQARLDLDKGYAGVFIDDVNLEMRVSDASEQDADPIDPRTGHPMTDSAWRRYLADFTVEISEALPDASITQNAHWWIKHSDPDNQRSIDSADVIELERGFNDAGITHGGGIFGYETFLNHIDWLHARGKSVIVEPYGLNPQKREYEMASLFLVHQGNDAISSDFQANPDNWWPGWETDLGAPQGARHEWKGLWRRDFEQGVVLVNQPDSATRTVDLDGPYRRLGADDATSVTLPQSRGAVLIGSTNREPTTTTTTVAPDPTAGGVVVQGEVMDPDAGKVTITVERRKPRGWAKVRRTTLAGTGPFRKRVGGLSKGRYRAVARFAGSRDFSASRSKARPFRVRKSKS